MPSAARKRGCEQGGSGGKPKTPLPNLETGYRVLDWMVVNLLVIRDDMRVYECRYSHPDDPHFHVGHKPGETRKNRGRMPARGSNHRR